VNGNLSGDPALARGLSHGVLAGTIVSIYAALFTFAANVVGASIMGLNPFELLRVYATFFMGGSPIDGAPDIGVVLGMAMGLHLATAAIVGMPLYVVHDALFRRHGFKRRAVHGLWLGIVMWLVNYYALLSWLQPLTLRLIGAPGEASPFILQTMPPWVAALTHICFAEIVLLVPLLWSVAASVIPVAGDSQEA
jgi:hypothetical protein